MDPAGMSGGCTDAELEIEQRMFPGRKRKSNTSGQSKKRRAEDMRCRTCKEPGHGMVTSRKCKHNNQHKAWRGTNPPKKAKFKPVPIDGDANSQQATTSTDASAEANAIVIDDDSPEAQTGRDAQECHLMDSLPLDDDDDDDGMALFDAMECLFDDDDSDKEN